MKNLAILALLFLVPSAFGQDLGLSQRIRQVEDAQAQTQKDVAAIKDDLAQIKKDVAEVRTLASLPKSFISAVKPGPCGSGCQCGCTETGQCDCYARAHARKAAVSAPVVTYPQPVYYSEPIQYGYSGGVSAGDCAATGSCGVSSGGFGRVGLFGRRR